MWSELPQYKRDAATALGITEYIWDDDGGGSLDIPQHVGCDWDDLTTHQRRAAEALDSARWSWDRGTLKNASSWVDLNEAEQNAAVVLGHRSDGSTWDHDIAVDGSGPNSPNPNVTPRRSYATDRSPG